MRGRGRINKDGVLLSIHISAKEKKKLKKVADKDMLSMSQVARKAITLYLKEQKQT